MCTSLLILVTFNVHRMFQTIKNCFVNLSKDYLIFFAMKVTLSLYILLNFTYRNICMTISVSRIILKNIYIKKYCSLSDKKINYLHIDQQLNNAVLTKLYICVAFADFVLLIGLRMNGTSFENVKSTAINDLFIQNIVTGQELRSLLHN